MPLLIINRVIRHQTGKMRKYRTYYGTGISQWESSIEIRLGIVANLFFFGQGRIASTRTKKNPLVRGGCNTPPTRG